MGRVKSVLLVDFDNIALGSELSEKAPNWMRWLEDGAYSIGGRKRKWISRRVYWNLQCDRYRPAFERLGFEAFSCRAHAINKMRAGKSSADVFITMDAMELAFSRPAPDEIIILSADTDFIPLVNRLQNIGLRAVAAGNPNDLSLGLYREHADAVVSWDALSESFSYQPARSTWFGLKRAPEPKYDQTITKPKVELAPPTKPKSPKASHVPKKARNFDLDRAAAKIIELGSHTPDQPVSRTKVIKALEELEGFNMNPVSGNPAIWLGCGSYVDMLQVLSRIEPRLTVRRYDNGGIAVAVRSVDAP